LAPGVPHCKVRATGLKSKPKGRDVVAEPLTVLLAQMQAGDRAARDAVFSELYRELSRLAHARLRDSGRNTLLDTTALVNESYLRFVQIGELKIADRGAFFGYASQVMRSVIVDSARARLAECRWGDLQKLTLSTDFEAELERGEEGILRVHDALLELEQAEPRAAKIAQMRYFSGYSDEEIAESLGISERSVRREWMKARVLLRAILQA
jgi:RNA polymerase sigma factor (TIGR02999 family)